MQDVLKDVKALIPFPICGLRSDDLNSRACLKDVAEAFQTRVAGFVTRNAFQYGDLAFAAQFFCDELAGEFTALVIV